MASVDRVGICVVLLSDAVLSCRLPPSDDRLAHGIRRWAHRSVGGHM